MRKTRKSRSLPKPFGRCPWSYWLGYWGLMTPWGSFQPLRGILHRFHLWQVSQANRKLQTGWLVIKE